MDQSKSLAELAAMKARGEITQEQFEEARLLIGSTAAEPISLSVGATPPKKGGCSRFFLGVFAVFALLLILGMIVDANKTPEERAAEKAKQEAEAKAANARKTAEENAKQLAGFHCLSAWDGSQRDLVQSVKKSLRDPNSFEHIQTKITPQDGKGQNTVMMEFRARNGFGGMNVGIATGTLKNSDCALLNWELISN